MFTDLAVIDWIALVFAAVILAAACAAAVIAYATSFRGRSGRRRVKAETESPSEEPQEHPVSSSSTSGSLRWSSPEHAKKSDRAGIETVPARVIALSETGALSETVAASEIVHARDTEAESAAASDAERKLADRAARLRGRPVPEPAPRPERSVLEHTPRVHSVMVRSSPAHATSLTPGFRDEDLVRSNYDRVEGFKARTPGFFDDPMGRHELRYWDGHTWTEYVKESGERFTDPL